MKISDLTVGHFYFDGKVGVREITGITGDDVTYVTHSAKNSNFYEYSSKSVESIIGTTSTMKAQSFASWAKTGHDKDSIKDVLIAINAGRIKLSPTEVDYIAQQKASKDLIPIRQTGLLSRLASKGIITWSEGNKTYALTPIGLHLVKV